MRNLSLLAVILITLKLWAAPVAGDIKGVVVDSKNNQPLDFVSVAITKKGSGKIVNAAVTGLNGGFNVKSLPYGLYNIKITLIGYENFELPFQLSEKNPDLNLGKIELMEMTQNLSEVQIIGQKSQMRLELDRKVFDVSQSAANAGAAASDVLRNIPSIDVDVEGNVSLRNSSNVTIWINGRPSGINSDNQAQVLEQLPSESIDRIEVITNPSSKYSASGTAGIINIILKKDRKLGYFGSVNASLDSFLGYSVGANVNVSDKKYDAYFNVGYRDRRFESESTSDRQTWDLATPQDVSRLLTESDGERSGGGVFARAGYTYHVTDKDHVGLSGMAMTSSHNHFNDTWYEYPNQQTYASQYREGRDKGNMKMGNVMLDYQKQYGKSDELRASVAYSIMDMGSNNTYRTFIGGSSSDPLKSGQTQKNESARNEIEIQVDGSKTFSDLLKLEFGYKGEIENRTSTQNTYEPADSNNKDYRYCNQFSSLENTHALYLSGAGKLNKFTYQVGLRGEFWKLNNDDTQFDKNGTPLENSYSKELDFDLFPSLFLTYSFEEGNDLQINYSRRINRPGGRQMRPFKDISDSLNVSFGNPNLRPDYSNSLELNYLRSFAEGAHSLSSSLYFRNKKDGIFYANYVDNGIKYSTYDNIITSADAGVEFVSKNRLFKILDLTTTLNFFYNRTEAFTYRPLNSVVVYDYPMSESFQWNARMIAGVMVPGGYMLQLIGGYNSPVVMPQGRMEHTFSLDAGVRKSFFDKKLMVSVTARDIFNSRKMKITNFANNYREYSTNIWGGRMFGLALTYNFGNTNANKTKKKSNQSDPSESMDMGGDF